MIYYNEMFNIDVVVDDSNLSLPIFKNHDTGKVYKPFLKRSNTGLMYPMINLNNYKDKEHKLVYCHRIVAYTCLPKTNLKACISRLNKQDGSYYVVDHKSGNTLDYRPENLRFLTNSENVKHVCDYMRAVTDEQIYQLGLHKLKKDYKIDLNPIIVDEDAPY